MHTAVKIAPGYTPPVVHVTDASRSVPVLNSLLNEDNNTKDKFYKDIKEEYIRVKENYLKNRESKNYLSLKEARDNKLKTQWDSVKITRPKKLGITVLNNYSLNTLREYIDWSPFFLAWELKGKYPAIFDNSKYGTEAKKIFEDANKLLNEITAEQSLTANGVLGLFPANTVETDDIEIYTDEKRNGVLTLLHTLRSQSEKTDNLPNLALADYIAPKESGKIDYIGAFAVTTGIGLERIISKYEKDHDDYNSIMAKALADRLAEAFAEHLHQLVRKEYWGYAAEENLSYEELIKENYKGIRPAPGYPAQPDHSEKLTIFNLLKAEENACIQLTENLAMYPAASVCGIYFAHPESRYFNVGKIGKDQVLDYHRRKGMSVVEVERWLKPVLNYD